MDHINRELEHQLLGDVQSGSVWPFSDFFRVSYTSDILKVVHNGSDGRFDGSSSISFWCRLTMRVATLVQVDSTWYSAVDLEMQPSDLIIRVALLKLRNLRPGLRDTQTLSVELALSAQEAFPFPSSQEVEVDGSSEYDMIYPSDSEEEFEYIADGNSQDEWDDSVDQHFAESILNEEIELPLPSIRLRGERHFGHVMRRNGHDARLGGHPSITYFCLRTNRTVTLAVPSTWNWGTTPNPERIILGAIILMYRDMGARNEIEAILDDELFARAKEWADSEFENIDIGEQGIRPAPGSVSQR